MRDSRSRVLLVLVMVVVVAMVAVGCDSDDSTGSSTSKTAAKPPAADTLTVGSLKPASIDPATVLESAGLEVVRLVFDPLTEVDEKLHVVPAAAQSWTASPDNTTFVFKLRPGATFSNGRPVTADDFVFSFNRLADPDLASGAAYKGSAIAGWDDTLGAGLSGEVGDAEVSGVRAIDPATLEVRTTEPFSLLPTVLSDPVFSPVPRESVATEKASKAFGDRPIGNGRYELTEPWDRGNRISLKERADHWSRADGPDAIEFRIFSNPGPSYAQFEEGNLDVADVPVGKLAGASASLGDRLVWTPIASMSYVGIPDIGAFREGDIRKALSLAIDREAITDRIFGGTAAPGVGQVPAALGGLTDACSGCRFDPDEAKGLYDRAGGVPNDQITLEYPSDVGIDDYVEAIANDWSTKLGVDTKLAGEAYATFVKRINQGRIKSPFAVSWSADYPSSLAFLGPLYESTSPDNPYGYDNPAFDARLAQARAAPTTEAATALLEQAQELVDEDLPTLPVFEEERTVATRDRVRDVIIHPMGYLLLERVRFTS